MRYTRIYAEINLDAVEENMKAMKANVSEKSRFIGVVKADGYGHGAVPVAKAMDAYVWGYATATVDEAMILKCHGIEKPILILGSIHPSQYELVVEHELRATVFQLEKARLLSELAVKKKKTAYVHLAVDTGMSRIGMRPGNTAAEEAEAITRLPGIMMEGMFTHFARADERNKESADRQLARYLEFADMLEERGITIPFKHCSNSAAIIDLKDAHMDLVRAGISIYGLYPSDEVDKEQVKLHPALTLKSTVTYVKDLVPGDEVSYGGTFTAAVPMVAATIPVGYGDGYPRNLSGKGWVLIHGRKAPILGRVCMDQMMVDVTEIPDVKEDDDVVLIGRDGGELITVEELCQISGGFHYEFLCGLSKRIPRVYLHQGIIIGNKDYFNDEYKDFKN